MDRRLPMKSGNALVLVGFILLVVNLQAQDKVESVIDTHNNVRLIEMAVPQDMHEELRSRYQVFLPMFIETLKEETSEQPPENALTIRIVPGIKEIGSAKIKRVVAKIIAYRRNTKSEYIGNILLHSYATGENVSKEEIGQFLVKQILTPLEAS
jgi:hypothetical protein